MKKALKIVGLVLLVVVAVLGGRTYFKLKEAGIIPRKDYETVSPEVPTFSRPAVLVLHKTNGFVHKEGIPAADAMFKRIANARGWDIYISDSGASHNPEVLAKFALVVWNNVSGDVLTESQRAALRDYVEQGGGWVGVHGAGGDFEYDWRWYVEELIGAQFKGHTMDPQFQDADVLRSGEVALTEHLSSPWRVANEEWYAFDSNPRDRGYEVLLTLDESSYITRGPNWMGIDDRMEGEHPIAWRHVLGKGRVFYSAIGHQAATYQIPEYEELIGRAMAWALGATP